MEEKFSLRLLLHSTKEHGRERCPIAWAVEMRCTNAMDDKTTRNASGARVAPRWGAMWKVTVRATVAEVPPPGPFFAVTTKQRC